MTNFFNQYYRISAGRCHDCLLYFDITTNNTSLYYEWKLTLTMKLLGIYKIRASCQTEYVTQALKIKRQRKKKIEKIVRLTLQVLWKVWTQESFQK